MRASGRPRSSAVDWGLGSVIGLMALVAYGSTLAPTVLDGDAALFQYLSSVMGVAYPTGYPTYILLGRLWQMMIPFGAAAWRMNAFSAVCGALSLVFVYRCYTDWLKSRLGGAVTALLFGTLPTFWRWSTESKSYTLHILFLASMLFVISRGERQVDAGGVRRNSTFVWLMLLFGVSLGNHNTTLLLAPGLALLYWLNGGRCRHDTIWQAIIRGFPFVLIPLLLYTYIPLRANQLLTQWGLTKGLGVPVAVARGLVSDFYAPGWSGLWRYLTAADFTGGVVTNWGLVPGQLVSVYWPMIRADFTTWGVILVTVGAIFMAIWNPRRFWPLFAIFFLPIPFVLTYGQGEQSAFLLPSNLILAGFGGAAIAGLWHILRQALSRWSARTNAIAASTAAVVLLGIAGWLPAAQTVQNVHWLREKWSDAQYRYWSSVLAHPMDEGEGAGLMAHWGDLTTMWYLQHVDDIRPDVYGLFPPSAAAGKAWLDGGHALYVAGPLQGWGDELLEKYQIVPWGRMVRLIPQNVDAAELLPPLNPSPSNTVFGERISLLGESFPGQALGGELFPVTLTWEAVGPVPANVSISLRLTDSNGKILVQSDEALLSGWLPVDNLQPGQRFLSYHPVQMPSGTWPGDVLLEIALADQAKSEWQLQDGSSTARLGEVRVTPHLATSAEMDPWHEYKPGSNMEFGAQLRLVGYDYSVTRAGQGKGFAIDILWQSLQQPASDYTLLVQLVDIEGGQVRREWRHIPTDGYLPTSQWQASQMVRDRVDLVLPADMPPGENSMAIRLGWLTNDDTLVPVRRWGVVPSGSTVSLPGIRVVEKEGRVFDAPTIDHSLDVDFDGKIRLLGYSIPSTALNPGETVSMDLVWQSLTSDMDTSYTVFVHLIDPDGRVRAQGDKIPGYRSKQPTTGWVAGEIVVDPISMTVPENVAPGNYLLRVGLYIAPDGPRLPTLDHSGKIEGDFVDTTQVRVNPR